MAISLTTRPRALTAEPVEPVTAPPAVELRAAARRYGDVEALRGVDLTIARGELTAVLGPNGAGKTTMLSLILGLRQPTSGTVRVVGEAAGSPAARRRVGAMLQESGVPPTLTVGELVELFGSYYPSPRPSAEVIAAAGLEGLERRKSRELWGGQRQGLLFALALCGDPELVVLDEPTTGMDVESRRRFWSVITDLAAPGTTVLFATHLLDEADALARRVIVLSGGQVVADGTPADGGGDRAGGRHARPLRGDVPAPPAALGLVVPVGGPVRRRGDGVLRDPAPAQPLLRLLGVLALPPDLLPALRAGPRHDRGGPRADRAPRAAGARGVGSRVVAGRRGVRGVGVARRGGVTSGSRVGVMIRILIVDDHQIVRTGLRGMFETDPGFEVAGEAADGAEAVAQVRALRPDVVLMDLQMPGVGGVEAIRSIRATPGAPPVLVLTVYDSDAQILRAIESGASGNLLKDATRDELFRAVRSVAAGGSPLAPEVAARLMPRLGPQRGAPEALSTRELEVVRQVAQGRSNKEIAFALRISEATVKTHLVHAFEKLGVTDRTSAVTTALERGLIDLRER